MVSLLRIDKTLEILLGVVVIVDQALGLDAGGDAAQVTVVSVVGGSVLDPPVPAIGTQDIPQIAPQQLEHTIVLLINRSCIRDAAMQVSGRAGTPIGRLPAPPTGPSQDRNVVPLSPRGAAVDLPE